MQSSTCEAKRRILLTESFSPVDRVPILTTQTPENAFACFTVDEPLRPDVRRLVQHRRIPGVVGYHPVKVGFHRDRKTSASKTGNEVGRPAPRTSQQSAEDRTMMSEMADEPDITSTVSKNTNSLEGIQGMALEKVGAVKTGGRARRPFARQLNALLCERKSTVELDRASCKFASSGVSTYHDHNLEVSVAPSSKAPPRPSTAKNTKRATQGASRRTRLPPWPRTGYTPP